MYRSLSCFLVLLFVAGSSAYGIPPIHPDSLKHPQDHSTTVVPDRVRTVVDAKGRAVDQHMERVWIPAQTNENGITTQGNWVMVWVDNDPQRSLDLSPTSVMVTFDNRTDGPIDAIWVDLSGDEKSYGQIDPGDAWEQQTYHGHLWRFLQDGRIVGTYQANAQLQQTLTIGSAGGEDPRPEPDVDRPFVFPQWVNDGLAQTVPLAGGLSVAVDPDIEVALADNIVRLLEQKTGRDLDFVKVHFRLFQALQFPPTNRVIEVRDAQTGETSYWDLAHKNNLAPGQPMSLTYANRLPLKESGPDPIPGPPAETEYVSPDSSAYYVLGSRAFPGKVADVFSSQTAAGTNVILFEYTNNDNQQFRFVPIGDGFYYIESKLKNRMVLDINNWGQADQTNINIEQRGDEGTTAQRFKLIKADDEHVRIISAMGANFHIGASDTGNSIVSRNQDMDALTQFKLIRVEP